jgi:hypothetical protein
MRAVPCLCQLYPGICLTTEKKARKNLSEGRRTCQSSRVPYKNNLNKGQCQITNAVISTKDFERGACVGIVGTDWQLQDVKAMYRMRDIKWYSMMMIMLQFLQTELYSIE